MRYRLLMGKQALSELARHGAFARMMELINQRQQKLDDLLYRLERSQRQMLEQQRRRWESAAAAVRHYDVHWQGTRREDSSHGCGYAKIVAATAIASGAAFRTDRGFVTAGYSGTRLRVGIRFFGTTS